jgi:hypothetical protein
MEFGNVARVGDFVEQRQPRKDVAMRVLNTTGERSAPMISASGALAASVNGRPSVHATRTTEQRTGIAAVATVLLAGALACGAALAQRTGGPTPSRPGAEVYFVDLKDGATVPAKVTLYFGLRNMGVAPAGSDRENSGHHHLLIDADLPPLDKPIPSDFNHLHFGAGQTEAKITLPMGKHTLQLLLADENHVPHDPPIFSEQISVTVNASGRPPAKRYRKPRRWY